MNPAYGILRQLQSNFELERRSRLQWAVALCYLVSYLVALLTFGVQDPENLLWMALPSILFAGIAYLLIAYFQFEGQRFRTVMAGSLTVPIAPAALAVAIGNWVNGRVHWGRGIGWCLLLIGAMLVLVVLTWRMIRLLWAELNFVPVEPTLPASELRETGWGSVDLRQSPPPEWSPRKIPAILTEPPSISAKWIASVPAAFAALLAMAGGIDEAMSMRHRALLDALLFFAASAIYASTIAGLWLSDSLLGRRVRVLTCGLTFWLGFMGCIVGGLFTIAIFSNFFLFPWNFLWSALLAGVVYCSARSIRVSVQWMQQMFGHEASSTITAQQRKAEQAAKAAAEAEAEALSSDTGNNWDQADPDRPTK